MVKVVKGDVPSIPKIGENGDGPVGILGSEIGKMGTGLFFPIFSQYTNY